MDPSESEVECYSGHTYAQEPRAVVWRGRRCTVVEIEERWRSPEGPVFRVRLDSGARLQLCYSESEARWLVRGDLTCCPKPDSSGDWDEEVLQ